MLDFFTIAEEKKKDRIRVYPKFIVNLATKDLMIQGGDFYAVWDESIGLWSRSEQTVVNVIDDAIRERVLYLESKEKDAYGAYMIDSDSGSIDKWHKFCQRQMRDTYKTLDETVTFANTKVKKDDYVSRRLSYPLEEGDTSAYEELIGTLYEPKEKEKLEWAIGAIISGDAKHIQKFEVLYGSAGTGKSTILNIIGRLFEGYTSTFNAKELASANNAFALESFKSNPLVSIQHDGDLSKIEDNTKLNSVVSHETLEVNAKYTRLYTAKFNTFIFMGTNKPVKITEAKSGLLRRLIDVSPSGKKVPYEKYRLLMNQIAFELGAIAYHCLSVYEELGESYYDSYTPVDMMSATNDFFDFIDFYYDEFAKANCVTLTRAWNLYKEYCDFASCYKAPLRVVRTELRNYFKNFDERGYIDGKQVRNLYSSFLSEKFNRAFKTEKKGKNDEGNRETEGTDWLTFIFCSSVFDELFYDWDAQYTKDDGTPVKAWRYVKTKLKDIDSHLLHYVRPPNGSNLICIDFDIKNAEGEKDLNLNIKAALNFKPTYAELSKSGGGIHLYYFYDGDVTKLLKTYAEDIEIKVFTGNASIRRLLTKCNDIPIATINSGLPVKGDDEGKLVNWEGIKNEKMLRTMIIRNLRKEYHPDTTSSINYIYALLEKAYNSDIQYDVSNLYQKVLLFAMSSTHQSDRCVKTVAKMHFKSKEMEAQVPSTDLYLESEPHPNYADERLVFFDCEVYKNLFVIVWKFEDDNECHVMINPEPREVEELFNYKLVGFNCRKYDNHILYARSIGKSLMELYELSQDIIVNGKGFFGAAYNLSYTDVLDFVTDKMSLKKYEIKLGIHHQEMGIPWDEEVPENMWDEVAAYCTNDVLATESVFKYRKDDFNARQVQVDLVKLLHPDEFGEGVSA